MSEVEQFVARAVAFCDRAKLTESTVSRKLLGNGLRLGELQRGKSLRVDTLAKAQQILTDLENGIPA